MLNTTTIRNEPGAEGSSAQTVIDIAALSHRGNVRQNNEDSFLVTRLGRTMTTLATNLPPGRVPDLHAEVGYGMMVADGMGGAAGGEVASQTAISALVDLAIQTPDWILKLGEQGPIRILRRMEERFDRLKDVLAECVRKRPELAGMGTTLTLAVSLGADLIITHVGDSRAYLFTHGKLLNLTKDQTMAQMLADLGVISAADVDRHHSRHVLTGAITASGQPAEAELRHLRLTDGDQLLLCSDGLTEMVPEAQIAAELSRQRSASEASHSLVDLALDAGGTDNITVIVARYQIAPEG